MSEEPIVVVGAGPAGAGLAWLLARRGLPVVLVERQRDFDREFRGEVLMPGGLQALREMDLQGELDASPHVVPATLEVAVAGRVIAEVPTENIDGQGAHLTICSQPEFLERIVARCSEFPNFEFRRGCSVREVQFEKGRVASVRLEGDDGAREQSARLVIGADGRASIVRKASPSPVREIGTVLDIVWTKVPMLAGREDRVHFHVKGGHLFVGLPSPDGLMQVAWVILKGHFGELKKRGMEDWVAEMSTHVGGELGDHLQRHASDFSRPFLLDAKTERVEGWQHEGLLLIGDAAHTMSPVGGQGVNVALRDAIVAANHLVPALLAEGDARSLDEAGARIEAERAHEIDTIQRIAAIPPRVIMRRGAAAAALRWLVSRVAPHLPIAQNFPRVAAPFLYGVDPVKLRV